MKKKITANSGNQIIDLVLGFQKQEVFLYLGVMVEAQNLFRISEQKKKITMYPGFCV